MKWIALFILGSMSIPAFAQKKPVEFEGIVWFSHQIIAKDSNYNIEYDYSAIGKKSEYNYKKGNIKFVNHDSYFEFDLFKSGEQKDFVKTVASDTVLWLDTRITDLELVEYDVKKSADKIL